MEKFFSVAAIAGLLLLMPNIAIAGEAEDKIIDKVVNAYGGTKFERLKSITIHSDLRFGSIEQGYTADYVELSPRRKILKIDLTNNRYFKLMRIICRQPPNCPSPILNIKSTERYGTVGATWTLQQIIFNIPVAPEYGPSIRSAIEFFPIFASSQPFFKAAMAYLPLTEFEIKIVRYF